jgi:diguanylate cyclase
MNLTMARPVTGAPAVGRTSVQTTGNTSFWLLAAMCAVASIGFAVWVGFAFGGATVSCRVDDIGEFATAAAAAVACGLAARRLPAARLGWALLSASCAAWAAGEAVWSYYELVRGIEVPFPSLADIGFLAAAPLTMAGLWFLPGVRGGQVWRLRGLLDGLLVAGALFFGSWVTVLQPLFHDHQVGLLSRAVSLAYPISDVVVASLVVMVANRCATTHKLSLAFVMAGLLSFAAADSSFAYLSATNSFGLGNALDVGWFAGYLLLGLGAIWAGNHPAPVRRESVDLGLWPLVSPYIPLVGAGALFVWSVARNESLGAVTIGCGFGLVVILSARQLVMLVDNLTLTRQLDSKVRQRTAELNHRAFHDALTGLPNRALFTQHLANAVQRRGRSGATVCVLFVDIDDFKQVNDLHGHETGDAVLRYVGERFRRTLREADTVARFGGDEFAVLVEGPPDGTDPATIARRLLRAVDRPFRAGSLHIQVRLSIGVASDIEGVEGAAELLRNADLAMYTAKSAGGNHAEIYAEDMHSAVLERMRLEAELHSALEHDEFVLYYQPVVELASGRARGVEALIRWQHPRRGLLGPGEFISTAESTGLIVPIGNWTLRTACRQACEWMASAGVELDLAVNISAVQLADDRLVTTVATALADSGLAAHRLTLEVTESVIMDDLPRAIEALHVLRRLGIKVAIDDFGTGYSSLSALRDLPVDILKIDRSFVTGVATDRTAAALARRILQLSADFGLHTIAEGVERGDQLTALRRLGCESVQGFLISQPVDAQELLARLRVGEFDVDNPRVGVKKD